MLGWAGGAARSHLRQACLAVNERYLCHFPVLGLLSLAGAAACKQVILLWLKGSAEWCQLTEGRHWLSEMQDPKCTFHSGTSAHPVVYCSIARSRHSSGVTKTPNSFFCHGRTSWS